MQLTPPMSSRLLFALRCLLFTVLLIGVSWMIIACRATATPSPTLAPAPTPTTTKATIHAPATMAPTAAQPMAATGGGQTKPAPTRFTPVAGPIMLEPFAVPLPESWVHVLLVGEEYRTQLDRLAQSSPLAAQLIQQMDEKEAALSTIAIAWPTTAEATIGLIAQVTPRAGLTLPGHLRASAALLLAQTTVTVHEARLDYALRTDVPVGYLRYTGNDIITNYATMTNHSSGVTGYHYLLFDADATYLLRLTIVTDVTDQRVAQLIPTETPNADGTVTELPFAALIRAVVRQTDTGL
ncbi:MAG: hypothetical protein R2932_40495 [Caldilineaceae bacterium]